MRHEWAKWPKTYGKQASAFCGMQSLRQAADQLPQGAASRFPRRAAPVIRPGLSSGQMWRRILSWAGDPQAARWPGGSPKQGAKVLVREAGPNDSYPLIHIPAGFVKLMDSKLLYQYQTKRQEALSGRAPIMPQGNVLCGGSVNAVIYVRGQRSDYDDWARSASAYSARPQCHPHSRRRRYNSFRSSSWTATRNR
ncbi:MAG: GMC family oxidoreductase N-terminal domain-containing protein [Gemmobacter sp.]